ncbi:MAG: S-layer homology domain-containing protein [Alkaliphilus sp.]
MRKVAVFILALFLVFATVSPAVASISHSFTISIDNEQVKIGETVQLSGTVLIGGSYAKGAQITIKVVSEDGTALVNVEQLTTDANGQFVLDIKIHEDLFRLGSYVIDVNSAGEVKTLEFEVIPTVVDPPAPAPAPAPAPVPAPAPAPAPTPTPTPEDPEDEAEPEETEQGTVVVEGEEGEEVAIVVVDDEKILAEVDDETVEISIDADVEGVDEVVVEISTPLLEAAAEKELPIVIDAGHTQLEIPAGLLGDLAEGTVALTLKKLSEEEAAEALEEMDMLDEHEAVSELIYIDLTLDGETLEFEGEITITIPITLDENGDPRKIGIYYLNEETGELEFVGGVINEEEGTITFTVTHFSMFMAMQLNKTFDDISIPWAQEYIEVLASRHVIKGIDDNTFAPNNNITRAQFATLLVRALDLDLGEEAVTFGDLAKGAWYEESVLVAASNGIVKGFNNEFDPNGQISREAMATMIVRALKLADVETEYLPTKVKFTDEISDWALDYVSIAYKEGIVTGFSEVEFGSSQSATRAQAAVMIYRLLETLAKF